MKILSIGNSFSQDAQRYLHQIASANKKELMCANLYIGGCPLKKHFINLEDNEKAYDFELNGVNSHIKISIKEALQSNDWDYITLQQASHESFKEESYSPYLEKISDYIKLRSGAKILLHQTWAYPEHRERLSEMGFKTTEQMFLSVREAYEKAEKLLRPDGVIRSGEAMLKAYKAAPDITYRDVIHASLGFGRYLLGCVWYTALFGEAPKVHITDFDEPVSSESIKLIESIIKA